MARSDLSAALVTQLRAIRVRPIWFVEIALPAATLRYTTNPTDITHRSASWLSQHFNVKGFQLDGRGNNIGSLTFQNVDKVFAGTFRQAGTEGSIVKLYHSDGKLSASEFSTDPESSGQMTLTEINQVSVTYGLVTLNCKRQKKIAVTTRCDAAHGFNVVSAPGVAQYPAGAQVLY